MAPGDFPKGCKILAEGFIAGLTVLANVIMRGIESDREWHKELRERDDVRDAAHDARMAAITEKRELPKL